MQEKQEEQMKKYFNYHVSNKSLDELRILNQND